MMQPWYMLHIKKTKPKPTKTLSIQNHMKEETQTVRQNGRKDRNSVVKE